MDVVDGVRDHVALGLMSHPGLSKTSQVKQWAEEKGRNYCELIISQRMPSEISGMPMPVAGQDGAHGTMEIYDFETLLKLEDGDVLAFDEFTNGNIQTLNACLTLIQERTMLSGKKLPSLIIVAMGNPQGRCDLLPQTKQRFWWVDVAWDASTWREYMRKQWGIVVNPTVLEYITRQYRDGFGDVHRYNYHTPRTMENLFRIAKNIGALDDFWSASEVDRELIDAIYLSLGQTDQFGAVQAELLSWFGDKLIRPEAGMPSTPDEDPLWEVMATLSECANLRDLRSLIEDLEDTGVAPEFVAFMKSAGGDIDTPTEDAEE